INDSTYLSVLSQIQSLGAARDALATQIKNSLFNAEFNDTAVSGGELADCNSILSQAGRLAAG
ncbi:MAG: hypothetical protein KGL16_06690, partial [Acidobacteriota bacterium]|nr:hypothetical protein [Acidobacteriota bacterium]